ncbi:FAD-dependent oxidoreductase [Synechocystis sp. LKSZ1]|uniref:FAD-dependent oxidoreductase n=1 Tax=Synechocystis sp. LKSZ1 TaxID=3144951 RepID=UPI00336BB49A
MPEIQASAIESVDVAVVGGGIAGVAISEYIARHSTLSIRLLEQQDQLGAGSSGKLEGWFHSGALYSGQDDGQTFMNCVNSLEDLINGYSPYFGHRCNVGLVEAATGYFQPQIQAHPEGWFNPNPVYLIHPRQQAPELHLSGLKGEQVQMQLQLKRVLGRLEMAYGRGHNWLHQDQCQAPSYAQVENYEGLACTLLANPAPLQQLCQAFDQSFGFGPGDYALIRSLDCAMDTYAILRDCVASALALGVTIETGIQLETLNSDRYGPVRLKSLVYRTGTGQRKHLKAQAFIFAVGAGFGSILGELQVRARLKQSRSAMIVAYPALSDLNFVRMSTKNRFHFNHFVQSPQREEMTLSYSMLANSGYTNGDNLEAMDIEPLLDAAERYFGRENLYRRHLYSYDCIKTEFVSDDEQKRRYSYWIEADPQSNYLCVLPGKFSFFPTVALQAFRQLKTLVSLQERPSQTTFRTSSETLAQAAALVALPYPQQILAKFLPLTSVL